VTIARALLRLAPSLLFVALATQGAIADSATYDEGPFLHYGMLHLAGEVSRNQVFNSKLPVTALHAAPVLVLERFGLEPAAFGTVAGHPAVSEWAIRWGRVPGILLGAVLVALIGGAARTLGGARAGQAAALLAALEPNLLAHFHLVTADGGATLAGFLVALATVRFARTRATKDAALLGGAIGLVLLCKFMLVVWVALALVAVLVARAFTLRSAAAAALVALIVLDLGFGLRGLPGHLPELPRSHKIGFVASVVGRAPLPLPESYLEGLDWTAGDEERGNGFGVLYLLGDTQSDHRGWWFYYLVVFALKTPLPIIVLGLLGLVVNRGRVAWIFRIFALGWLAFLSLGNHAQIGIRHALPIVPLVLVECGLAYVWLERRRPWLARSLVVWLALSVVSFGGDYVPYTNELVLDRKLAYRLLADSNLDWGQARVAGHDFARRNGASFEPPRPVHGRVLVSVNALLGITEDPKMFAWLRDRTPVGHVRHAVLIFEVP
jgi:hypothetical protein